MANDISGINSGRSQQTNEKQVQTTRRDTANTTSRTPMGGQSGQDKVSLTDMASRLKSLENKLAEQPDVDQARVDRVRTALARGEYRVNPDRVADKMMDFESGF
jgi:negative regulator of flagellin synthesis FlgM